MNETRPPTRLCFIHIPKTAGAALTYHLQRQFPADKICPARYHAELPLLPAEDLRRYRLFAGHFSVDARDFFGSDVEFATVLRKPIDRVLSVYRFLQHFVANYRVQTTAPEMYEAEAQYQMELAKGLGGFVTSAKVHVRRAVVNAQTAALGGGDPDAVDRRTLERAKENLRRFASVGVTERMQASMNLLAYHFGWAPFENLHINETPRSAADPTLDPADLALIEERNELDTTLYAYAAELFSERYQTMRDKLSHAFPEEVVPPDTESEHVTRLIERHYEASFDRRLGAFPRGVTALAFGPVGPGWYSWEPHGSGGFRWTGPSTTAVLDLVLIPEQPVTIGLHIVAEALPGLAQSAQLELNGQRLDAHLRAADTGLGVLEALVPVQLMRQDRAFQRLALRVERTCTGRDRALGLAVASISVL